VKTRFSTSPECNYNFSGFVGAYTNLIDESCLCMNKPNSKRNISVNPWITHSIINSIKTKHALYKCWKRTTNKNDITGNSEKYLIYKNYRKVLKHVIKDTKRHYYGKQFDKSKGDMKKTWKLINALRGKRNENISPSFVIDSKVVLERRIIANEFNLYFTSIASKMNHSSSSYGIPIEEIPSFSAYMPERVTNSIFLADCDHHEIEKNYH